MGAIGAILVAQEDKESKKEWNGLSRLHQYLQDHREEQAPLQPLSLSPRHLASPPSSPFDGERNRVLSLGGEKIEAYLGLDVGSISTNLVVIDREKRVLAKRYLMTAGRPIEAVRIGLQEIGEERGDRVEIKGGGTTGSGRYLTAAFVGADLVRTEITAQRQGAIQIDPAVDTIFEIGGQDSKYISLDQGGVGGFEHKKV